MNLLPTQLTTTLQNRQQLCWRLQPRVSQTRGKQLRLSQGQLLGCGVHNFGYDYIKKTATSLPRMIINEREAKTVRYVFETYAGTQIGLDKIAQRLEEAAHPTKTGDPAKTASTTSAPFSSTHLIGGGHKGRVKMKLHRKAKIVATLGPASDTEDVIRALFEAGANIFRFNFSHGTHADHQRRYHIVRAVEREVHRPIAVLADLQGPKLRVGTFSEGRITLPAGAVIRFDMDPSPGNARRATIPHPEVFAALSPGVELLLDDGKIRLKVEAWGEGFADARVVTGGVLSDRKGVSVVGAVLPVSALTEKDRADLAFALDMGADWIALSFVQRPDDMEEIRALVGSRAAIMAKLEKPSAIDCLEDIIRLSDGLMVARGDLGVEMRPEQVPIIQREILRASRHAGKPVIVATQMLESMISAPAPTRAEASDVATAVYDGADAVMLSAESAAGQYPVQAVSMMDSIIREVEHDPYSQIVNDAAYPEPSATISDAICCALRRVAGLLPVAAAVTYTSSGHTSLRAARERPAAPILSMTPSAAIARRLTLVWGVHSVLIEQVGSVDEVVRRACQTALDEDFAKKGDIIAITAGTPVGVSGTTNLLKLAIM